MQTNIYVGNLPWSTDDNELLLLFSKYGKVTEAKVITERETGRSRGFGFVKMSPEDAVKAIEELNGHEHNGRELTVNEARNQGSRDHGGRNDDRRGGRRRRRD